MNLRTLSKTDTRHVVNICCVVLALGVTSYYYDSPSPNQAVSTLGNVLLSPITIADKISVVLFHVTLAGHWFKMFFILWFSYLVSAIRLSSFLMIRNQEVSELREWYLSRKSIRQG